MTSLPVFPVQDEDGNRPLHVCAIKNEPEIADLLVACHANPNLLNHNGHTPLLIACGKSYPSVVRSLLKVEDIDLSIQVLDELNYYLLTVVYSKL